MFCPTSDQPTPTLGLDVLKPTTTQTMAQWSISSSTLRKPGLSKGLLVILDKAQIFIFCLATRQLSTYPLILLHHWKRRYCSSFFPASRVFNLNTLIHSFYHEECNKSNLLSHLILIGIIFSLLLLVEIDYISLT